MQRPRQLGPAVATPRVSTPGGLAIVARYNTLARRCSALDSLARRWQRRGLPRRAGSPSWRGTTRPMSNSRKGSGMPMPRRRTFAAAFQAYALSETSALRHPCLRWPSTPALRAWTPRQTMLHEGRGSPGLVREPYRFHRELLQRPRTRAASGWLGMSTPEGVDARPACSRRVPAPRQRQRPPGRRPLAVWGTLGVLRDRASPPGPWMARRARITVSRRASATESCARAGQGTRSAPTRR
jgi:hypothetical protein